MLWSCNIRGMRKVWLTILLWTFCLVSVPGGHLMFVKGRLWTSLGYLRSSSVIGNFFFICFVFLSLWTLKGWINLACGYSIWMGTMIGCTLQEDMLGYPTIHFLLWIISAIADRINICLEGQRACILSWYWCKHVFAW